MDRRAENMDRRADGRKYSRITRRCVVIISNTPKNSLFTINEIAEQIHGLKDESEFLLRRFNRRMSVSRIRDYVRYLIDLGILIQSEEKYVIVFQKWTRDRDWAQALSDKAKEHLTVILRKSLNRKDLSVTQVDDIIEEKRIKILDEKRIPTLGAVISEIDIDENRIQEMLRWSLYLYIDGPTCRYDIRRNPFIVRVKK